MKLSGETPDEPLVAAPLALLREIHHIVEHGLHPRDWFNKCDAYLSALAASGPERRKGVEYKDDGRIIYYDAQGRRCTLQKERRTNRTSDRRQSALRLRKAAQK